VNDNHVESEPVAIQDIADVEYTSVETNDEFLCNGKMAFLDENKIILMIISPSKAWRL
jgi:hypothetical protein